MKNSIIGFPRIGKSRELKFASEKYFRNEISCDELYEIARQLRAEHWELQKMANINYIPSNDFSFYDNLLDLAVLLGVVPKAYRELGLNPLDEYFALARGYQGKNGDVKALAMKKWFNTNYHYMVPEIDDEVNIKLCGTKIFDEYLEAKSIGIETKPVITGGFTFLKLAKYKCCKQAEDLADPISDAYIEILERLSQLGAECIQIDEPILVTDLDKCDISLFKKIYQKILANKNGIKVILQTYFGDVRDVYNELISLDFDGIGLDFVEGEKSLELIEKHGFPTNKILFAGVVNGKNIWKNDYAKTLELLNKIKAVTDNVVISASCSLLHVPFTLENETNLPNEVTKHFAFAVEKLTELSELSRLSEIDYENSDVFKSNRSIFLDPRGNADMDVQRAVDSLKDEDFTRNVKRSERKQIQKEALKLPVLPTTTIGSFPQTAEVKHNRARFKRGEITESEYRAKNEEFIKSCIELQENIGLDVLVHGEYERNDMVEFFGENLAGYVFTDKAWVQSYGTRCVKPPIIFGDIKREKPITVSYSVYADSLTDKPVKGMLTGPITILNWSFPREDVPLSEIAYQIALAIRDEVLDLEAAGIKIIQIDEAALKEKLPLRRADRHSKYLDWAIKAFRLVHGKVKPETQIHTHMCYSEFDEIIKDIDDMDADVISFEASRSNLSIVDALKNNNFQTDVGPGIYDIHSPRVPSADELVSVINKILEKLPMDKVWINPDCGLKTRGVEETTKSLNNLVKAAVHIRKTRLTYAEN